MLPVHDPLHGVDAVAHSDQWWDRRWAAIWDPATWGKPWPVGPFSDVLKCEVPESAWRNEWKTDLVYAVALTVFILVVRFVFENYIIGPFVKRINSFRAQQKRTKGRLTKKRHSYTLMRLRQTLWRGLVWNVLLALGWWALSEEKSLYYTGFLYDGYPNHERTWPITVYYWVQMAHAMSLMVTVYIEPRKSDHIEMVTHHILTILSLAGSWSAGYFLVGAQIQFLHDIADWFLEWGKFSQYLDLAVQNVFFAGLIISWAFTRLAYFPFRILYANRVQTLDADRLCTECNCTVAMTYFMLTLCLLHWIWFYMILRVAVRALLHNDYSDVRESDSEKEHAE